MQLQTIKFTANEQDLQRTSGGSLFASSTVSYIRALFDLGENWGSWGAVRAVWKSRTQQIATVLADGACMVPAEVLANPGQVYVNLVASEVSGNVVTDRLTSYPVLAIVVDAQALVDGSETAEITPSQFEQFVEAVEGYSSQAIDARDRAEAAQEAAETAQGKAEAAQEAAETAQGKAEDAQGFAEEAATAAGLSAADADRSEGEAAAWATGSYSGGGIPVPDTAPQHNNNAKYYSEQAEAALEQFTTPTASASTLPAGSSATASYSDGNFAFGIPKGDKGDTGNPGATGPAAGFGEVSATVDSNVGTPSVEVSASGPDTAKQFAFAFHNLKGDKGDTGEVSEAELAAAIDKIAIKDTASGPIASFPDGADGIPVKSLVVNVEPNQDLHGYDNPWPAGGGKNLLNPGGNETIAGITKTVNTDGTIRFNGTATGTADFYFNGTTSTGTTLDIPDGTYRLYGTEQGSTSTYRLFMIYVKNGQTYYANGADHTSIEWTSTTTGRLFLRVYSGATIDVTLKLSFVLGVQDAWSPYSNICPITGWTGANVTGTGANIFGGITFARALNAVAYRSTIDETEGTVTFDRSVPVDGGYNRVLFDKLPAQCTVILVYANSGNNNCLRINYTDGTVQALELTASNGAKTVYSFSTASGKTVKNIFLTYYTANATTLWYNECGVFDGVIAPSAYTPYTGTTIPITWQTEAGTVYGGTDEVVSGEGKKTMEIVDLGSLNWLYSSGTNRMYTTSLSADVKRPSSDTVAANIVCSVYKADTDAHTASHTSDCICAVTPAGIFNVYDSRFSDPDAFKTAVTGQKLVYELATPTDFSTTPVTDLVTKYGQNNIFADCGPVDVEYRADTKLYIDKKLAQVLNA